MEKLKEKYGLPTAIAMIVGVVIGSGVFFKADDVLTASDGNLLLALLAWCIGAVSMIFGALVFAEYAQRIEKSNGLVDYMEDAYGKRAGYLVGWFNWVLYFSPLTAILAFVSANYTLALIGHGELIESPIKWGLATVYLCGLYALNAVAPKLSGDLQVTTTVIKLIPLISVAVVGIIYGLINGVTMENLNQASSVLGNGSGTLSKAVVSTAFAYEGWIVAITINSEIKDSKRNLPRALIIGTLVIFVVYVAYFLGIAGVLPTETIISEGDSAVSIVAAQLFGSVAATILTGFVVISCLGTLNGLVLANIRMPYSLAIRNQGPAPEQLSQLNKKTQMPIKAAAVSCFVSLIYLAIWYCSLGNVFGRYIGLDEIPIVLVYGIYILLYVNYVVKFKDLSIVSRFVKPLLAFMGASVILYGGITNDSIGFYLLISVVVLFAGLIFYRKEDTIN